MCYYNNDISIIQIKVYFYRRKYIINNSLKYMLVCCKWSVANGLLQMVCCKSHNVIPTINYSDYLSSDTTITKCMSLANYKFHLLHLNIIF